MTLIRGALRPDSHCKVPQVCCDSSSEDGVSTRFVLSLASCIGALNDREIVAGTLLPDLVTRMVEAESTGGKVRHHVIIVSDPLVALSGELLEHEVTESLIACSRGTESVHGHCSGHSQSRLDIYSCKGGEGSSQRVARDEVGSSWVCCFEGFHS